MNGREWAEQAREIESLGYDTLVMPDHLAFDPGGAGQFAPIPALMAAADATTRLRVSAMVFANDFRNPVLFAKEMTTIDAISGGRLDVGLGAGWSEDDYAMLGLRLAEPRTRIDRLEEAVTLMRRLFTEERVTYSGRHYQVRDAALLPRPTQRPHPPILIGGRGPRLLALAGRHADIVSIGQGQRPASGDFSGAALESAVAIVKRAAGARPMPTIHIQCEINVTDDAASAYEDRAKQAELPVEELRASVFHLYGGLETIHEKLIELRDRYRVSYVRVVEDEMRPLAPLVARMT